MKRNQLKIVIKTTKRESWQDFCEEVEQDPWGLPYKTVISKNKPRGGSIPTCPAIIARAVQHLFPAHRESPKGTWLMTGDNTADPSVEIHTAAQRICVQKAPGLDGISWLGHKTTVLNAPDIWRTTFSACLREGIFSLHWKVQRLVLLPKGEKPADEPSSYRSPESYLSGSSMPD